jgi:hypothetical protein
VFAYSVGLGMLLMGGIGVLRGMDWSLNLGLAALGMLAFLGLGRPLFGVGVYRPSAQEVLCRFVPWYQANTLLTSVVLPIIGLTSIAQGRQAGSPVLLRYGGYLVLLSGLVFAVFSILMAVRNRLRFSPSSLSVRTLQSQRDIPRDHVQAITSRLVPAGVTRKPTLHVDLTYIPVGDGDQDSRTSSLLDTQFTVDPTNLLHALHAWKDGDPNDPGLMDRVEAILRGQAPDSA